MRFLPVLALLLVGCGLRLPPSEPDPPMRIVAHGTSAPARHEPVAAPVEPVKSKSDRREESCAASRDERLASLKEAAVEWLKDSATIERAGGLQWYFDHCQRGVDQYDRLMPARCDAKLPKGGTHEIVELALDRYVDLASTDVYLDYTPQNQRCFATDGAHGGHLLVRKTEEDKMKRIVSEP